MMYTDEFVRRSGYMEVRLFFVNEESIRHPDVLDELGSNGKSFHSWSLAEG